MGCDRPQEEDKGGAGISIHAPTWGATNGKISSFWSPKFQSTHPRGVRHVIKFLVTNVQQFQSTHPRGVRHVEYTSYVEYCRISIHAPTWGATFLAPLSFNFMLFQSTHPRGVRLYLPTLSTLCGISIHAPTWGATSVSFFKGLVYSFQSTHPRGVRPASIAVLLHCWNFNPRTHVGCDVSALALRQRNWISIHAPTWGATPVVTCLLVRHHISIHAPTWGAT